MQDRKSIYSLNKADSDAIVYIDAEGHTIRLTRQDFATAEEFEKWKAWSDENFHTEEKSDHVYRNHTLRLSGLPEASIKPVFVSKYVEKRQENFRNVAVCAENSVEKTTKNTLGLSAEALKELQTHELKIRKYMKKKEQARKRAEVN